ncbi:YhjD/YihY/BrkB family envelope integrity protein [Actinomycetaceae bacterium MB13-C1-2]|nr:YhjD/YihY/BrkB family envelope integrity protein [Actinomycetaceae bacterium MB13-C1-2]
MSHKESPNSETATTTNEQWSARPHHVWAALKEPGLRAKVQELMKVYRHSRIGRAVTRYGNQNGAVVAGGITYMSIFSLAAMITVGWTVFAHVFSQNPEFQTTVISSINSLIPGVIADPASGEKGIIDPKGINMGSGNVVAGVIAFGVAVYSASRIVVYISGGIRAMFGLRTYPRNAVVNMVQSFVGVLILLVAVFATASLTLISELAVDWADSTFPALKELHSSFAFNALSASVPLLVNVAAFALFVRYVAGVRVPRTELVIGSIVFSIASEVLRTLGTTVVGSGLKDPVIAAAATVGTMMLWINFLARAALNVCAWMANPPAVVGGLAADDDYVRHTPNYVTLSDDETLTWPHHPISGDLIPTRAEAGDLEAEPGVPSNSGDQATVEAEEASPAAADESE